MKPATDLTSGVNTKEAKVVLCSTPEELKGIIYLQRTNLPKNISAKEALEQGFVTVEHSFDVLKRMNEVHPHIIAKSKEAVVGYALVMTKEFRNEIPVLIPMFERIDQLSYEDMPLSSQSYFVMGQVCIAKEFRGSGLFDKLYENLRTHLSPVFDRCITEVASRNIRSVNAHRRVGFKTIHRYTDPRGEEWRILLWKW